MNKDFVLGAGALALAVVYYVLANAIPSSLLSDAVGPAGLPTAYTCVLGGLALALMAKSRRAPSASAPPDAPRSQAPSTVRALGLLAIGVTYLVLVPYLGYLVALAILIGGTAVYQGAAVRQAAVVAAAGAVSFWLLFVVVLRIPHPPGFWPSLF